MKPTWDDETLVRVLREAHENAPEPSPLLVEEVLGRLAAESTPSPTLLATIRGRAADATRWVRARVGRLVAALAVLVFGVAVSPVGADVADWFDFNGVIVGPERDEPQGDPTIPPAGDDLTLAEAAELVAFRPVVPRVLGEPDAVSVTQEGRLLTMSWGSGHETVRLDQFDGQLNPKFYKASDDAVRVDVSFRDALWFPSPHEVDVLTENGDPMTLEPRLAAATLVWETDGVTFRLESDYTEGEAVVVAESAE